MSEKFLEEFKPEARWAADHNISARTVARYRQQPDGLPFLEFGGRIFIPAREGAEWVRNKVRRPNPTHRDRALEAAGHSE